MTDNEMILAYALLWLRSHYDVGSIDQRERVLARVDSVLRDFEPSGEGGKLFRSRYKA